MTAQSIRLHSLEYRDVRTYIIAALFVVGNVVLPQICHLVPGGGLTWLPIYFFTLVGAYKFGWRVGVITALMSPLINSMMFGMPPVAMLPIITMKSLILAATASCFAHKFNRLSIIVILGIVISYQLIGTAVEALIINSFSAALSDLTTGLPGLAFQVIGGYLTIRYILNK